MAGTVRARVQMVDAAPDVIAPDLGPTFWSDAGNIYFRNGETRRVPGDRVIFGTPSTEPQAMVFYTSADGTPLWVYAGTGGVFVWDGFTHRNITPTGYGAPLANASWTLEAWNGLVVLNHSGSGAWVWYGNPAARAVDLPDWGDGWRCYAIRGFREFLFAIGMLDIGGGQRVRWSDAAEPGTAPASWTPLPENFAGFFDLMPSTSAVFDGVQVRDSFLCLKGESVHQISYVGGASVMAQRELFRGIGIIGPNAWAKGPLDQIAFLSSRGDVQITDGVGHRSVTDGKSRRTIAEQISVTAELYCCGGTLGREDVSVIGFPTAGKVASDRGIVIDWASGAVGFRQLADVNAFAAGSLMDSEVGARNSWDGDADSWAADISAWNFQLQSGTLSDLMQARAAGITVLDRDATVIGSDPIAAQVTRLGLDFGDAQRRKSIGRVWLRLRGYDGQVLTVRVGSQETADGPVTWGAPGDWVVGQTDHIDGFLQGRFMAVEISSTGGQSWALGSVEFDIRPAGGW